MRSLRCWGGGGIQDDTSIKLGKSEGSLLYLRNCDHNSFGIEMDLDHTSFRYRRMHLSNIYMYRPIFPDMVLKLMGLPSLR